MDPDARSVGAAGGHRDWRTETDRNRRRPDVVPLPRYTLLEGYARCPIAIDEVDRATGAVREGHPDLALEPGISGAQGVRERVRLKERGSVTSDSASCSRRLWLEKAGQEQTRPGQERDRSEYQDLFNRSGTGSITPQSSQLTTRIRHRMCVVTATCIGYGTSPVA